MDLSLEELFQAAKIYGDLETGGGFMAGPDAVELKVSFTKDYLCLKENDGDLKTNLKKVIDRAALLREFYHKHGWANDSASGLVLTRTSPTTAVWKDPR